MRVLAAHDGDDDDRVESGAAEDFRAFIDGGAGGEDIVDEDRSGAALGEHLFPLAADGECVVKVFQAL